MSDEEPPDIFRYINPSTFYAFLIIYLVFTILAS
jgi:hypothetical protein